MRGEAKGRQQERTAPADARLIGCWGRAAAAAAAAVGYTATSFLGPFPDPYYSE